jgi:hypothetical protein
VIGRLAADLGFRVITLASESQALRKGATAHLVAAKAGSEPATREGGYH